MLAVKLEWNSAQGLSCGLCEVARPAYVLGAEHTAWIAAFSELCKAHLLGSFFGLCEVYCYNDIAALALVLPNDILIKVGTAQIGAVLAEFKEDVARLFHALEARSIVKQLNRARGKRGDGTHKLCFKQAFFVFLN